MPNSSESVNAYDSGCRTQCAMRYDLIDSISTSAGRRAVTPSQVPKMATRVATRTPGSGCWQAALRSAHKAQRGLLNASFCPSPDFQVVPKSPNALRYQSLMTMTLDSEVKSLTGSRRASSLVLKYMHFVLSLRSYRFTKLASILRYSQ